MFSKFTEIYLGRGRGFSAKIFVENLRWGPWTPGGPVARQRGGRLPLHYLRVGCPPLLICITKIPEKKRGMEWERRSPAIFSNRRLQVTKILLRFTKSLCCNYFCRHSRLAKSLIQVLIQYISNQFNIMIVCLDMSSKFRFHVHYGDYYISHDAYGVDLSAFERREWNR